MTGKIIGNAGAVAGAALVGIGGMMALPALSPAGQASADMTQAAVAGATSVSSVDSVRLPVVRGVFTASQQVVTPNKQIADIFRTATAGLCSNMPDYAVPAGKVSVGGSAASTPFVATVDEMVGEDEEGAFIMGCACAGNIAGGGAIVNAAVSGVPLAQVAERAGAL